MREVLSTAEVARILGTTPGVLRTLMTARRKPFADLPPSFRIGRRRVFLRRVVYDWLNRKAGVSGPGLGRGRSRSVSPSTQQEQSAMSEFFEVSEGDVFRDQDGGDELTVAKLYAERGYALLEDQDGEERTMSIERLLDAVEGGELVRVVEADEEDEAEEDEAEEEKRG